MLKKILILLGLAEQPPVSDGRRRHPRYASIDAEVMVKNRTHRVRDWSMGGIAFDVHATEIELGSPERIRLGDDVRVILKFRFPHDTITIEQPAVIVRQFTRGVAAEFAPLTAAAKRQFTRVMDEIYAENFLESQTV